MKKITELYDPKKTYDAPQNALLTYRGGPLLTNVEVFTIFMGDAWYTDAVTQVNDFFDYVLTSDIIDMLQEYSITGQTIGRGKRIGTLSIAGTVPDQVDDTWIQSRINDLIAATTLPQPNSNMLYFIYLPPNTIVTQDGDRSCEMFCGYHNNQGQVYYAVMPYPACGGCTGDMKLFDALTATSTHELCEAITDPVPGTGWYDDNNGEIGDIAAWQFRQSGNYTVQLEWSNQQKACI